MPTLVSSFLRLVFPATAVTFPRCLLRSHRSVLSQFGQIILLSALVLGAGSVFAQRPIGIDVSDYQSPGINWSTVKSYGITFAWGKASEGGSTDGGTNYSMFYATNAKNAGIIIGPYHYARYDLNLGTSGAITEANFFWNTVKNNVKADGLTLMPMLDVEAATNGYTPAALSLWINTWCTTVSNSAYAAGLRLKPCIYASTSHASGWFDSTVTNWNNDIAQWYYSASSAQSGAPGFAPWPSWTFWQYNDTNSASAYTGGDGDVFYGTMAQLLSTMVVTAVGPIINAQPVNVTVTEGGNATFSVSSTDATHYQWEFNNINISGATNSSFTVTNSQNSNLGVYSVLLSKSSGSTLSSTVYLTVLANPPGAVVAPAGLVDWWSADGTPVDIFGGVTGSPQGGFTYAAGETGQAFHFDGSTGVINLTAANIPVPWTACMWVNRQNTPQTSAALLADNTYSLKLEQYSNTFNVGFTQFGVADYVFSPAYTVPLNTWTHLAFVGTSGGVSLYANGVFQASLPNSIPLPRSYIGAAYVTSPGKYIDFMLGSLDEIMLFNRALSSTEINSIYTAGSAGVVKAAEFTSTAQTGPAQVTLGLEGQTGKAFTIYSSPDLTNWTSLGTVANPTGTAQYIDNFITNNVQLFYRASQHQ